MNMISSNKLVVLPRLSQIFLWTLLKSLQFCHILSQKSHVTWRRQILWVVLVLFACPLTHLRKGSPSNFIFLSHYNINIQVKQTMFCLILYLGLVTYISKQTIYRRNNVILHWIARLHSYLHVTMKYQLISKENS